MELRSALLASMTDVEKSVKNLVTEANLRLVGLWAPQSDTRVPSEGSAFAEEEPSSNLQRHLHGGDRLGSRSGNLLALLEQRGPRPP